MSKNRNTYEIMKLLKDNFWVEVEKVLIPNIKIDDLKSVMNYSVWVFFVWREVRAQNIFKLYPFSQLESSVPYGITHNKALLENIVEKVWQDDMKNKIYSLFEEYKKKNIKLFNKAKKFWIWFIIHDFHITQFLKDNFRWIPILTMLKDMWFHISFFVFNNKGRYEKDLEKLKESGFSTIISDDVWELDIYITDKNIHLYYSELSNDKRILSKNKQQFSIGDLEYGIEWFYRSFESLIKKCEKYSYYDAKLDYYLNK